VSTLCHLSPTGQGRIRRTLTFVTESHDKAHRPLTSQSRAVARPSRAISRAISVRCSPRAGRRIARPVPDRDICARRNIVHILLGRSDIKNGRNAHQSSHIQRGIRDTEVELPLGPKACNSRALALRLGAHRGPDPNASTRRTMGSARGSSCATRRETRTLAPLYGPVHCAAHSLHLSCRGLSPGGSAISYSRHVDHSALIFIPKL